MKSLPTLVSGRRRRSSAHGGVGTIPRRRQHRRRWEFMGPVHDVGPRLGGHPLRLALHVLVGLYELLFQLLIHSLKAPGFNSKAPGFNSKAPGFSP
jgi:hypothetical protein